MGASAKTLEALLPLLEQPILFICSGLTSLSTIFQSNHNGVWLRQGAQCSFYSAASLKYHTPDT